MNTTTAPSLRVIEIAFTGYPVTDMTRARAFYEGVLGLGVSRVFEHEGKAWIEYDVGSNTLAISNIAPEWQPSPHGPSIALEVENFDAAVAALRAAGTTFALEPAETGVCRMTVVCDPDGNSITLHKRNAP